MYRTVSSTCATFCTLFLLALAALLPNPVRAQEAPSAALVVPELERQSDRTPPDPALVPEVLRLPPAESAAAATLQALREQEIRPGVPYQNGFQRTGTEHRVEIAADPPRWNSEQTGQLRLSERSGTSWVGRFVVEGSYAFRVALRDLVLPEGAQIHVHSGEVHLGPFGQEMLDPEGTLWLPPAPGPEVVVEIELPEGVTKPGSELGFVLGDVMELVEPLDDAGIDPQAWTDCDIDAMCVSTSTLSYIDILREATARLNYVKGGVSYLCTGGLMNDKDDSGFRPYLLTANHCFDTQASASSLVAYFDYRTDSCNGTAPALWSVPSVSGATLLATSPLSDFTFVELSGLPSGNFWLLGWTTVDPTSNTSMHRVSHPSGTTQKYSASSFTGSNGIVCSGLPTSDFHYSQHYSGSTAPGSSGAPVAMFSDGHSRVVGQLLGVCRFSSWDECSYTTYNSVDGAFSTTFPFVDEWLNDTTPCTDAYEPDDAAGSASFIGAGSLQAHSLCPAGDEDWVWFSLGAEAAVEIETSGPSGDTRMWLYNSSLGQVEFDDDGGSGLFSRIDRTCGVDALPAGTYYVRVDEFGDNDAIDAYDLHFDVLESCSSCVVNLTLSNTTITGAPSYRADSTITLGPGLVVNGSDVDLLAGQRIVIGNGTRIGGSFSAGTHSAACAL